MNICVISILVALSLAEGREVPSIFQKCKETDDSLTKCLTETANQGWPELVKEDETWATIHLEPFDDEIINLLRGKVDSATLTGLEDIHFTEIKPDLKKKVFNVIFTCPRLSFTGNVELVGNVLGLRLAEKGPFNVTNYDGVYNFRFKYDLKEKDGQQYAHIKNHAVVYNIAKLTAELYGEDQKRNERTNKLFQDNWEALNSLISDTLKKIFAAGFASHVEKFMEDIPFSNLFE